MKKMCLAANMFIVLILIVGIIIMYKYVLSDESLWKSPYDEEIINQEIGFDGEPDNLEMVIDNVEHYVNEWIDAGRLISIRVRINKNNEITRCFFTYDIENIDDYLGFCRISCYYSNKKWVIESASKEYLQDDFIKNSTIQVRDILDKYAANKKFLNDNDFFGGTDAEILIRKDEVEITIWGLDEDNNRCIMQIVSR